MQLRYISFFFLLFILHTGICKGKSMAAFDNSRAYKPTTQLLSKSNFKSKFKNSRELFTQSMTVDAHVLLSAAGTVSALDAKAYVAMQRWVFPTFVLNKFYEQRHIGIVPGMMAKILFPVHYFW